MAVHPESLLISSVIQTGEHQHLASKGITALMFHVYPDVAEWLERYVQRNGKAPSKQALRQQFPDFTIYKTHDVAHFCDEVRKTHKQQSLIDLMDSALNMVDAGDEDLALSAIQQGVQGIAASSEGVRNDFDVFECWEEIYDSVSARVDRVRAKGWAGIPTGFKTLDEITGGMQDGWYGVMAARLGQGKTWTGIRMGYSAAVTGHKVHYWSLEQSKLQIAMRVHAFGSRQFNPTGGVFNPMDLNRGRGFDIREYKGFLKEMKEKRGSGRFVINDTSRGRVSPSLIAAGIEAEQPDLVVIDYLTLLTASADDWRGTAKLSSDIQNIAQRYSVPIWALSQVNRMGIGKEPPGAEHLSQADAIGQDADLVLTMMQMSKSVQKMKLAKFRHGPGGMSWHAKFSPATGEYEEVDASHAEQLIEDDQDED